METFRVEMSVTNDSFGCGESSTVADDGNEDLIGDVSAV